jgi:carbon monoxide dehydrogenase subunit G
MLLKIAVALVVLIAAVLVLGATRPGSFEVQRSVSIHATPEKIFPLLNDLHRWADWNQQARSPSLKIGYSGAPSGIGAIADWEGSGQAGKVHLTVTESSPSTLVEVSGDWERPFRTHNLNQFVLTPSVEGTRVTWKLRGTTVYPMKVMSLFTGFDRLIGPHLDESLRGLKELAEH